MTESVESPERIWIESEGGCPYFYHEDELSDVGSPVTEYVRADKLRAEIEALRAEVAEAREFRDKLANAIGNDQLRRFIEKHGEPVPLTIRMQEAEARAERLAEALRKLEEREQRDEALLRQALEVLSRAHQTAMVQTIKARIPECAEFGGIAQDLDFVVAALRERLGEGAEP